MRLARVIHLMVELRTMVASIVAARKNWVITDGGWNLEAPTRGLCSISTHAGSVVLQRNLRMSDCSCQIWQGLSTALDLGLSSFWHASVHRCSRLAETFAPVQSLLQRCAERFWSFLWKARIRYNKVTLTESANHYRASQHVHESTALDQYFSSSKLRKKLRSQYFVFLGFGEHKPKKSTNLLIV